MDGWSEGMTEVESVALDFSTRLSPKLRLEDPP